LKLSDRHPIFVGYKMDGQLRRTFEMLTGSERKYIDGDGAFLTILNLGEDRYVGKVVTERITTDRVDDIRRNVISILQRLNPETRFPKHLDILVATPDEPTAP
jgi:hypothetical protein